VRLAADLELGLDEIAAEVVWLGLARILVAPESRDGGQRRRRA
jgi:hypothetical protein